MLSGLYSRPFLDGVTFGLGSASERCEARENSALFGNGGDDSPVRNESQWFFEMFENGRRLSTLSSVAGRDDE